MFFNKAWLVCITVAIGLLLATKHYGQSAPSYKLVKAKSSLTIDGKLNEPAWADLEIAKNFIQTFPTDTAIAAATTEVKVTYDDEYLYIGAIARQQKKTYIVQSLKRDFGGEGSDYFAVIIDPFADALNGFHFGVSPAGVQWEALISTGTKMSPEWDNKWFCAVQNFDEYWEIEIAIPFRILRYRRTDGINQWKINFVRQQVSTNEISTWGRVPFQFSRNNLAFTGHLNWNEAPPRQGSNISFIPFITGAVSKDFEQQPVTDFKPQVGFDSKIAVTPSLNLDVTVNPDFSQVEADQQITNLSRFELFFPERRQFFLENSDLFSNFGFATIRPFFSRRIGLIKDTSTGFNKPLPILYGARLSGSVNKDWRIGLMNLQTAKDSKAGELSQNYTVAAVQRRVFSRSNLGAIFINKQNFGKADSNYFRTLGIDYNILSADNRWRGKLFSQHLFTEKRSNDALAAGGFISYTDNNQYYESGFEYVGKNYQPGTGFVPRNNYMALTVFASHTFYGKENGNFKNIVSITPGIENIFNLGVSGGMLDRENSVYISSSFRKGGSMSVRLTNNYIYLFNAFDPTNTSGQELPAESDYSYTSVNFNLSSNPAKRIYFNLQTGGGGFFNGSIFTIQSSFNYRYQPFGIVTLNTTWSRIKLPTPYTTANLLLIGPRIDFTFTKNIFWTTFIQYNNQLKNLNINTRLQWRYKPVSDLFIVYTDNYFPDNFKAKNRAFVLKLNYWFNL